MEKKKGSDHFRDILNPYGEKSNYGKIGRRRRLSKLNVLFFSIILSVTINHPSFDGFIPHMVKLGMMNYCLTHMILSDFQESSSLWGCLMEQC